MGAGREETVDDKEILRIFEQSEDPFMFTGEVADELGFSNEGAIKRLKKLNRRKFLASKKAGNVPGWWLTDRGRAYLAGELDAEDLETDG